MIGIPIQECLVNLIIQAIQMQSSKLGSVHPKMSLNYDQHDRLDRTVEGI